MWTASKTLLPMLLAVLAVLATTQATRVHEKTQLSLSQQPLVPEKALPAASQKLIEPIIVPFAMHAANIQMPEASLHVRQGSRVHNLVNDRSVSFKTLDAKQLSAVELKAKTIVGDVRVRGNLQVSGDVKHAGNGAASFIETMAVVSGSEQHGDGDGYFRQFRMVAHESFDQGADGWTWEDGSSAARSTHHCGNGDMFLSARCDVAQSVHKDGEMQVMHKTFSGLGAHTQLELTARAHFIDSWRGSSAFAMIDGAMVWLESHGDANEPQASDIAAVKPVNLCGNDTHGRDRLSVPVKVIVPHDSDSVTISFGTTIPRDHDGNCEAALGVDDVTVSVH